MGRKYIKNGKVEFQDKTLDFEYLIIPFIYFYFNFKIH